MNAGPENAPAGALMRRATYASIALAAALVLVKCVAWLASDSVSLLSSFLDSLLDGASALVNLVAVRQALTPADREHRFGHGKAEPLASLGQAAFIAGSAVLLIVEALQHLLRPVTISHAGSGIAVMAFSITASLALVRYQEYVVRRTGSLIITADALHYRTHLVLDLSVILSLVLSTRLGWLLADPLFGAGIGLWIIYSAVQVARQAIVQLMDQELPDAERRRIREIALANPQVRAVHDLRTRTAGPNAFIQIHLEMDGDMPLRQSHQIADAVEAEIRAAYPRSEVLIHQDPEGVEEPRAVFPRA